MAKCEICGKGVVFGLKVSHSNRKTNRSWKPNIRKVRADIGGTHKTVYVCSRCLRSGKLTRVQPTVKVAAPETPVAPETVLELEVETVIPDVTEAPAAPVAAENA